MPFWQLPKFSCLFKGLLLASSALASSFTLPGVSGRNKGQKLVGHFLKIEHFVGY